ncbi:MAG: hypothetical protein HXY52_04460 [Nitrospirae bacterium]|nr:hypothetical protein [Nitrospirota bacterium]
MRSLLSTVYNERNNLPPEIRIILYLLFVVSLFIINNLKIYFYVLLLIAVVVLFIPFKHLKKGWIFICFLLFFAFVSNLFFQNGRIIYKTGYFYITEEGLNNALIRTLRILFMIAGVKILTASTEITYLIKAVERLLSPLEKIGVPVKSFFQITVLTYKSLPVIKDNIYSLYKESKKTEVGSNIYNKIQNLAVILLNFFINSIKSPEKFFKKYNGNK